MSFCVFRYVSFQLKRLTYGSRFEEGARLDINDPAVNLSSDADVSEATGDGSIVLDKLESNKSQDNTADTNQNNGKYRVSHQL